MSFDDLFELGYVEKAHGLNGELVIFLDTDYPENYRNAESVFIIDNENLVPFFISEISVSGHKALVKFDDVNSREEAEGLKGTKVYLPLDLLPQLRENQFYYHEVYGFDVSDASVGIIGKVTTVYEMPGDDLLVVASGNKEILIPINDTFITKVDKTKKTIRTNLPSGFMEVYA